jgi:hypothetical protein
MIWYILNLKRFNKNNIQKYLIFNKFDKKVAIIDELHKTG